jgi:hypothetical protein
LATAFGHLEPEIMFRLWHSFVDLATLETHGEKSRLPPVREI